MTDWLLSNLGYALSVMGLIIAAIATTVLSDQATDVCPGHRPRCSACRHPATILLVREAE